MNPQILEYIRQQRAVGLSDETIKQNLLASGWILADVVAALTSNQQQAIVFTNPTSSTGILSSKMTLLLWVVGGLVVLSAGAYYVISHQSSMQMASENLDNSQTLTINTQEQQTQNAAPQTDTVQKSTQAVPPNPPTAASTVVLQCAGVKIPMPAKWTELALSINSKLGADGCYKDNTGCLCAKKDPNSSQGVVFAVLVAAYPAGFTLDGLVANAGSVSDVKKFNFLGYPAVRFTAAVSNKMITTAFIKDQKLYRFDFGAPESTFDTLWPDMEIALQGIKF